MHTENRACRSLDTRAPRHRGAICLLSKLEGIGTGWINIGERTAVNAHTSSRFQAEVTPPRETWSSRGAFAKWPKYAVSLA